MTPNSLCIKASVVYAVSLATKTSTLIQLQSQTDIFRLFRLLQERQATFVVFAFAVLENEGSRIAKSYESESRHEKSRRRGRHAVGRSCQLLNEYIARGTRGC